MGLIHLILLLSLIALIFKKAVKENFDLSPDGIIKKLNLKTELLELNTTGILKDILTSDYEVSLDLSDIDISEEEVSKALNLNQEFTLPLLFGNINLNDGFINYNFSQNNNSESSVKINGQRAHTADSFTTIVIESHWVFSFVDQLLVKQVDHFQER